VKRTIQRLCRKFRGDRNRINLEDLEQLKATLRNDYRRLLVRDSYAAEHEPSIVGLYSSVAEGKLEDLVLTISTSLMLKFEFAGEFQHRFTFCCDGTYKRVTCDYPLIVCGMTTYRNHFQVIAASFVLKETTKAYSKVFEHIQREAPSEFHPSYMMADTASMITAAARRVFPLWTLWPWTTVLTTPSCPTFANRMAISIYEAGAALGEGYYMVLSTPLGVPEQITHWKASTLESGVSYAVTPCCNSLTYLKLYSPGFSGGSLRSVWIRSTIFLCRIQGI